MSNDLNNARERRSAGLGNEKYSSTVPSASLTFLKHHVLELETTTGQEARQASAVVATCIEKDRAMTMVTFFSPIEGVPTHSTTMSQATCCITNERMTSNSHRSILKHASDAMENMATESSSRSIRVFNLSCAPYPEATRVKTSG